jgi:hypothetical protein
MQYNLASLGKRRYGETLRMQNKQKNTDSGKFWTP